MNFKNSFSIIVAFAIFIFCCTSCKRNTEFAPNEGEKGTINLEFDNIAGSQNFAFNTNYTNAQGEQFKVDMLRYFISNVTLKTSDGNTYTVPQDQSYFLIDEALTTSQTIKLLNIPAGDYSELSFVIGVDSLRNTMDISRRTGALDIATTASGMYWTWNSGYIFFKMEGTSESAPLEGSEKRFRYHIGSFGGYTIRTMNNVRNKTLVFGSNKAIVRENKTPKVHLTVDILKMFNNPSNNVSIATNHTVMAGPFSGTVANNYVEMFAFDYIHN